MRRDVDKGFKAFSRGLPISAFKVRPIADRVRSVRCSEAVAVLGNSKQKGARFLLKTVESAVANVLHHHSNTDEDELYIKELYVDEGPSQKRMWARARGRADRIIKRSAHISVILGEIKK